MKIAALSLLVGSAAAFAPAQTGRVSTANAAAMDDLKALAEKSNPVLKVRLFSVKNNDNCEQLSAH